MLLNQPLEDICITMHDSIGLYQIGHNNLSKFSQFVFEGYAYHYFKKYNWYPSTDDLYSMQVSDEKQFANSVYFGYKNSEEKLIGTIKATRREKNISFPIEYEFNINIDEVIKERGLNVNEVWHLGRLAIDSNTIRNQNLPVTSREILRLLLIHSLGVINHQPNNLMIAESDELIYEIFRSMGINMQAIGELKTCLGSPTYPVIVTGDDINSWLEENQVYDTVMC